MLDLSTLLDAGNLDLTGLRAEQPALAGEAIGWQPLADDAYVHHGNTDEEDVVIDVVGIPEVGMMGLNILLLV